MPKLRTANLRPARANLTTSRTPRRQTAPAVQPVVVSRPTRDWAAYNNELVGRGKTFTFILDRDTLAEWKVKTGRRGYPPYSVAAITACYELRALLKLPLRQTQGMLESLFELAGVPTKLVPDFSTLSKRRGDVTIRPIRVAAGGVLLMDGTGISVRGRGAWADKKYGRKKRRFVRVTVTIDGASGGITAAAITPEEGEGTGEVSQVPGLLDAQPEMPDVLVGDGAYDTHDVYETCAEHEIRLVTPPRCNATFGLHPDRDLVLRQRNRLGSKVWKQTVGYHCRSWVESGIGALKQTLGDTTAAHTMSGARADVVARINAYNRFLGLAG